MNWNRIASHVVQLCMVITGISLVMNGSADSFRWINCIALVFGALMWFNESHKSDKTTTALKERMATDQSRVAEYIGIFLIKMAKDGQELVLQTRQAGAKDDVTWFYGAAEQRWMTVVSPVMTSKVSFDTVKAALATEGASFKIISKDGSALITGAYIA